MGWPKFILEWREFYRFRAMPPDFRSIVFYAEDASSWKHYEPIIMELIKRLEKDICYITSDANDPILHSQERRIKTFYIGLGTARTFLFLSLQAGVMVMTMPDINNFHIKRSKNPTRYIYLFHSLVSTHMIYRKGAFDHFDTILCAGPHHVEEIRATEALYGLKPKTLIEAGHGLLDSIIEDHESIGEPANSSVDGCKRVLVAPSWGPNALLETCGEELAEILLDAGYQVTVRPHLMTTLMNPKLLDRLRQRFGHHANFNMEVDTISQGTVRSSDIMISDWSGAALEYAFGLERPVLFVDVPKKVNNPEYEKIACVPIEVQIRSEIGAIVAPDRLMEVPQLVESLTDGSANWTNRIRELRARWTYNVGNSGVIGASYIAQCGEPKPAPTSKN